MEIKIIKDIMERNKNSADLLRKFLKEKNSILINVMGSPGAGKTSFILSMIKNLKNKIYVIEGDVASDIDAKKIMNAGIDVVQINTGGACHLIADTVFEAIRELNIQDNSIIFVENIGNLICPSSFDIGENIRVVVSSIAEGDDKPYKYPDIFKTADIVILSKVDIIDVIGFDKQFYIDGLLALNQDIKLFEASFKLGNGIEQIAGYLASLLEV